MRKKDNIGHHKIKWKSALLKCTQKKETLYNTGRGREKKVSNSHPGYKQFFFFFLPIGVTPSFLAPLSIPSCVSQTLLYFCPRQVIVHADLSTFQLHFCSGIVATQNTLYLPLSLRGQAFFQASLVCVSTCSSLAGCSFSPTGAYCWRRRA